jgi:tetratricopeptide (TPR) repeat protein
MSRIKIPGKEKNKKILLIILVIITIGILFHEAWTKMNVKSIENKEQKEIMKSIEIQTDVDESGRNNSKTNNDDENIKISEKENNYSVRENELYNEAYKLFFLHDYDNAINKADELIKEFPTNARGYNIRGIAKAYNGNYDAGMKDIDNSLGIDENYGYARFNKALTYELYDNMDKALEWYNKAIDVEDYVWSYYGIASIYGRRGDVTNTIIYLNKAIKMDVSVKEVVKSEHDFDPVKNSEEFKKLIYN